jgi:hypothetical protein
MIPAFFEEFKDVIENMIRPPSKALVVIEEGEDPSSTIPAAQPIDEDGNLITPNGKYLRQFLWKSGRRTASL